VGSGEGSGPRTPDSEAPAVVWAGSGMTSAHSDAKATVESVAPVIKEGSEGEGDRQGGASSSPAQHPHTSYYPPSLLGKRIHTMLSNRAWRKGSADSR